MAETSNARRSFIRLLLAAPLVAFAKRLFASPTAVERAHVDEKQIAHDALDALMNRGDGSVPSGKSVSVPGTTEVTFANGKISKFVSAFDHNLLRSQMGAPRVG